MIKRYSNLAAKRKASVRLKLKRGKVRLNVFRSNKKIYAQIIDVSGKTVAGASGEKKVDAAYEVGKKIAEKAKKRGISQMILDRGRYKYHGRVKALAQGAREGGLKL